MQNEYSAYFFESDLPIFTKNYLGNKTLYYWNNFFLNCGIIEKKICAIKIVWNRDFLKINLKWIKMIKLLLWHKGKVLPNIRLYIRLKNCLLIGKINLPVYKLKVWSRRWWTQLLWKWWKFLLMLLSNLLIRSKNQEK